MTRTPAPPAPLPDDETMRQRARETWALGNFGDIANVSTLLAAPTLVRVAGVRPGQRVLDVGSGTGVVALAARRAGGQVTASDLTPELLEQAKRNADWAGFPDMRFDVADAEELPYPDASFDVVLSQFGHMFAPHPERAAKEMLRVLRPGGTLAFSTWPTVGFVAKQFALLMEYVPLPPGAASPLDWGDPALVRQRLGPGVRDLHFEFAVMGWPALSPRHCREAMEAKGGPTIRAVRALEATPERLREWRTRVEAVIGEYLQDHAVRHDYLLTRCVKG